MVPLTHLAAEGGRSIRAPAGQCKDRNGVRAIEAPSAPNHRFGRADARDQHGEVGNMLGTSTGDLDSLWLSRQFAMTAVDKKA